MAIQDAPRIVFEDPQILVIDKPAGLLSQGDASGLPTVVSWAQEYLGRPYVGLVHRLDRNTSGLMVLAKRTKSAQRLTDQIQDGRLRRRYEALVCGSPPEEFVWEHWLLKNEATNTSRAVRDGTPGAKRAVLRGKVLARGLKPQDPHELPSSGVCRVEFELETGRHHQIRAQAKAQGFPLVGDQKYGTQAQAPRVCLHSSWMELEHPISKAVLSWSCHFLTDLVGY